MRCMTWVKVASYDGSLTINHQGTLSASGSLTINHQGALSASGRYHEQNRERWLDRDGNHQPWDMKSSMEPLRHAVSVGSCSCKLYI